MLTVKSIVPLHCMSHDKCIIPDIKIIIYNDISNCLLVTTPRLIPQKHKITKITICKPTICFMWHLHFAIVYFEDFGMSCLICFEAVHIPLSWTISNSPRPCGGYMLQWTRLWLVQIMCCCLLSATPVPTPMSICNWCLGTKFSEMWNKMEHLLFYKILILISRLCR